MMRVMPRRVDPDNLIACCAVELDRTAPEWIPLMSAGPLNARDGRKWRLDNAPKVIARSREVAGDTDLVIRLRAPDRACRDERPGRAGRRLDQGTGQP